MPPTYKLCKQGVLYGYEPYMLLMYYVMQMRRNTNVRKFGQKYDTQKRTLTRFCNFTQSKCLSVKN